MKNLGAIPIALAWLLLSTSYLPAPVQRAGVARNIPASGPTYILNEDWEGVGLPSGWSETGGSGDPEHTTTVAQGSESYEFASAQTRAEWSLPAGETAATFKVIWRNPGTPAGNTAILYLRNSSNSNLAWFQHRTTDVLRFFDSASNGVTGGVSSDHSVSSTAEWLYIWIYVEDTGAGASDFTIKWNVRTTGTFTGWIVQDTTNVSDGDFDNFRIDSPSGSNSYIDTIQVIVGEDTSDF